MEGDDDSAAVDTQSSGVLHEDYEPPVIVVLGTLEELTQGPVAIGGDMNGMVISF